MTGQRLSSREHKAVVAASALPKQPRETDLYIGRRLREARIAQGLSQSALGRKLGITFQQVQKYESGANRVGGSRLWDISRVLELPIDYFFEGLATDGRRASPKVAAPPLTRRSLELAKEIDAIEDERVKKLMLRLVRAVRRTQSQ